MRTGNTLVLLAMSAASFGCVASEPQPSQHLGENGVLRFELHDCFSAPCGVSILNTSPRPEPEFDGLPSPHVMTVTASDGTDVPQEYMLVAGNDRVTITDTGCGVECDPSRVLNDITIPVPECTLVPCQAGSTGLSAELSYEQSGRTTLEVIDENGAVVDTISFTLSPDLPEF